MGRQNLSHRLDESTIMHGVAMRPSKYWWLIVAMLVISTAILSAFDLPFDLLELDLEEFETSDGVRLEAGWMVRDRSFTYFGVSIPFTVAVNKRDTDSAYVYFTRPPGETDTFVEFFRDFLSHYVAESAYVEPSLYHRFDEPQLSWRVRIPNKRAATIYRFFNADTGLRGFGMQTEDWDEPLGSADEILSRWPGAVTCYAASDFEIDEATIDHRVYIDASYASSRLSFTSDDVSVTTRSATSPTMWLKSVDWDRSTYNVVLIAEDDLTGWIARLGTAVIPLTDLASGRIGRTLWISSFSYTPARIEYVSLHDEFPTDLPVPTFELTIEPRDER